MNENNPDVLTQAGDYNLNVCQIVSYRMDGETNEPVTLDIIPITQAIELTEDIFNATRLEYRKETYNGQIYNATLLKKIDF